MHHLTVHRQGLHLAVGEVQDRATGGLIDTTALHTDKTVLDHVNATDAMTAADLVQCLHDGQRIERLAIDGHTVSLDEIERDHLGLVRGLFRTGREFEHPTICRSKGVEPRILQDSALIADVEQIAVHRVGLLSTGLDRHLVAITVGDHLRAARKFGAEPLLAPRSDHLEIG